MAGRSGGGGIVGWKEWGEETGRGGGEEEEKRWMTNRLTRRGEGYDEKHRECHCISM